MADMHICGLFEWEMVKAGWMEVGRCRDCFHENGYKDRDGNHFWRCSKRHVVYCEEQFDCEDWAIDTK